MVSVCTVPARGGRSCEHFGGYKTINRIPLPFNQYFYVIYFLKDFFGGHEWVKVVLTCL